MERICKYCEEKFVDVNGKWFSNHVRWCDKNPNRNNNNILVKNQEIVNAKFGEYKEFLVVCYKCNKEFYIEEREKLFPKREKYYCNRKCANSRDHSIETKEKMQNSAIKYRQINGKNVLILRKIICQSCNKEFETKNKAQNYCSVKCVAQSKKASTEYLRYKADCKFKFNVWDYPDEFDLDLIYKYGWYKAKNHGDNLTGISRDHRISVMFGWENGIDPAIISHPANCQLMRHNENISKHKKCSVVLEELQESINKWNIKYK